MSKFILLLILSITICAFDQWESAVSQSGLNGAASNVLTNQPHKPFKPVKSSAIFFLDANEAFAACLKDKICHTTDGGRTWNTIHDQIPNFSFVFVDPLNGWGNSHERDGNSRLMRTTDGGRTWKFVADLGSSIQSIAISSTGNAIASTFQSGLYRSSIDKDDWMPIEISLSQDQDNDAAGDQSELETGIKDVVFNRDETLVGFGSGIWLSSDGGRSWETKIPIWKSDVLSESMIGNGKAWLVGSGSEMYSSNDGRKWKKFELPTTNYLKDKEWIGFQSIFFISEKKGWIVRNDGVLFQTTDGANTWQSINSSGNNFREIYFSSDQIGFAVTMDGELFQTQNGGRNWVSVKVINVIKL